MDVQILLKTEDFLNKLWREIGWTYWLGQL